MTKLEKHSLTEVEVARFWAKVQKGDGCWKWTGAKNAYGYGLVCLRAAGKQVRLGAHRVAWQIVRGPIPNGLTCDHLCRNRDCVNPDHLEPVTNRENVLRGIGHTAVNARKTHCVQGHELSGDNLYIHLGKRYCKKCRHTKVRAWRKRKRDYVLTRKDKPT